ncbi:MAG: hypothetical protein A2445_03850 [Candidatus Jacksonbacteria bacterium RIFOXYC2_FULL_44_29]|nr:MAG: hypothetical protein A2295_06165 [Candidatus Jacksonbacteria bacterium RIFOXYB2_FULL_44_15]OGY79902.1 MAG: hypothetical protein A2445_03850 [Candidatus Jacksonbacteria bacterium RIFOXYC2_FULL_44_29]HCC49679.1 hypothetical protein [Candidatus Jacksonbacteria bacterium]
MIFTRGRLGWTSRGETKFSIFNLQFSKAALCHAEFRGLTRSLFFLGFSFKNSVIKNLIKIKNYKLKIGTLIDLFGYMF